MIRGQELIRAGAPLCALALVGLLLVSTHQGDSADDPPGEEKKRCVLVLGIDGLRSDALKVAYTPNLDALSASGAVTYSAFAGGVRGTPTQQITSSGPGWASLLTGVWTDKHRVTDNSFGGARLAQYPHFFKYVKEARPDAVVASFIDWEEIDTKIVEPVAEYFDHRFPDGAPLPPAYTQRDQLVLSKVEEYVAANSPDAMVVYFGNVDIAGHGSGFSPVNSSYISAIEVTDEQIGKVLEAIRKRPEYADEDWMTVVSTDHGGSGTSHGGQSLQERTIFLIASGGDIKPRIHSSSPGHTAVPPTAMRHLGIPVDPAWGWEAEAFGYPPYSPADLTAVADPNFGQVTLTWSPAEEYDLRSQEILRDGEVIATLPITSTKFTDSAPVPPDIDEEIEFTYTLRATGADADKSAPLTASAAFYEGPVDHRLVVNSAFDGDLSDGSGTLTPPTQDGLIFSKDNNRQYLELQTSNELMFGRPDALKFGQTSDFTVSFLVKMKATSGAMGTIVGNRSLGGNSTRGWSIGTTRSGQFRWEISDGRDGAQCQTLSPALADGRWHHVSVTHDRDGAAIAYLDGIEVHRADISDVRSVDASADFRIGGRFAGAIDDLQLWQRRLLPEEIRMLAAISDVNHPPFHDAITDLRFDGTFGEAVATGPVTLDTAGGVRGGSAALQNIGSKNPAYLSLGEPQVYAFGTEQDFTASVWVKTDGSSGLGGTKSDPAILSNKNWRFGAGKGWAIAAGKDGRWQWNIGDGDNAHRTDYDSPAGAISDSAWHHLAVTHDRDQVATLYFDGAEIAQRSISEIGDIDSGLPTAIGTDGAFGTDWPGWFNGSIDNVQLWRRALSPMEIAFVFAHFTTQVTDTTSIELNVERIANYVHITYTRPSGGYGQVGVDYTSTGVRYQVERSLTIAPGSWNPLSVLDFDVITEPATGEEKTLESVTLRLPLQSVDHFRLRTTVE